MHKRLLRKLLKLPQLLKVPLQATLKRVPPRVWLNLVPKDVISLCYHVVSDKDLPYVKYYPYKNVSQFEADLTYIQDYYRFVDYDELVHHRLRKTPLPSSGFFPTFDDGLAECFTVIRPILLQRGIKAAFFLTTSFIDNREMFFESKVSLCIGAVENLSDEKASELCTILMVDKILNDPNRRQALNTGMARLRQVRLRPLATASHSSLILALLTFEQQDGELIDKFAEYLGLDLQTYLQQHRLCLTTAQIGQLFSEGFTIGAHGTTHTKLRRMSSPKQIESEIVTSCDIVRQLTHQQKVPFAFPYTGNGLEIAFLANLLRRYDFIELFFDTRGLRRSPTFVVNRIFADQPPGRVDEETSLPYQLSEAWSQSVVSSR